MERSIKSCVDGFIGASNDKCFRMDLTPEDVRVFQEFNTGQRAIMLMDFLYHVEMGMDLSAEDETKVQNVILLFEQYLLEATD